MKTLKKEYLKVYGKNKFLKVELYYYLGGMNYFTGKYEIRGYYISVSPVEKVAKYESYMSFTGIKKCILPVDRQSKKAENNALNVYDIESIPLINYVLEKNNLTLEG